MNNQLIEVADLFDSLHQTPRYSQMGYPMVRVADIATGNLQLEACLTVSESDFQKYTSKYTPSYGDIVISRVGTYGVFAYVNTRRKFCLGQNTAAYGVGQRSVLRSKTAAERSERPPVYYKKVVILL